MRFIILPGAWASATARDPTDLCMPSLIYRAGNNLILPPYSAQVWRQPLYSLGFSRFLVPRLSWHQKPGKPEQASRQARQSGPPRAPDSQPHPHSPVTTSVLLRVQGNGPSGAKKPKNAPKGATQCTLGSSRCGRRCRPRDLQSQKGPKT